MVRHLSSELSSDSDNFPMKAASTSNLCSSADVANNLTGRFAPPEEISFVPPPTFDEPPPPPPLDSPPPLDPGTGEDAYSRRQKMSQKPPQQNLFNQQRITAPSLSTTTCVSSHPPPPPPENLPTEPTPSPIPSAPTTAASPPQANISRAPVRYNFPPPPPETTSLELALEGTDAHGGQTPDSTKTEDEGPRSLRPGQKGFAERLMSKHGWTRGTGLGASGSGITAPLRVQLDKQQKKPDAEGGGFVGPKGLGQFIGGKKQKVKILDKRANSGL